MKVFILSSYGVYTHGNAQYQRYLDSCIRLIEELEPDIVFTTGGATNYELPNLTESESVKNYLISQNPNLESKIILETQSMTTLQNLEYCQMLLNQKSSSIDSLIVSCDSIRVPKVLYCALSVFNSMLTLNLTEEEIYRVLFQEHIKKNYTYLDWVKFEYNNLLVLGIPLERSAAEVGQQIMASLLEIAAYKYPAIHKEGIEWRKNVLWKK